MDFIQRYVSSIDVTVTTVCIGTMNNGIGDADDKWSISTSSVNY